MLLYSSCAIICDLLAFNALTVEILKIIDASQLSLCWPNFCTYTIHGPILVVPYLFQNFPPGCPLPIASSISAFNTGLTPFCLIFSCSLSGMLWTGWSSGMSEGCSSILGILPHLSPA